MRRDKNVKIISILVLCVAVLGLSLGFAAFSNMLTISSSATVKPDQKDFKLVAYGVEDVDSYSHVLDIDLYTSKVIGKPQIYGGSATDAVISSSYDDSGSNKITISNLHATWSEPGQFAEYCFMIKNEGKYDAYLLESETDKYVNISENVVCTSKGDADEALVAAACENIHIDVYVQNYDLGVDLTPDDSDEGRYIKIDKYNNDNDYGYMFIGVVLGYADSSDVVRADGDFDVKFPDINFEFTTVQPSA